MPILRRRSGRPGNGAANIDWASVTGERRLHAQILGHNSEESLATRISTGVASGERQLFAGGLGGVLASAFEPERNR